MGIPKMLYYDDELDACADERMAESCLNFPGLPEEARRKKVPLVFHGVIGQDLKEETSPSFFNIEEVVIVLDYIRQICDMKENKVQPKEIGVITPYRRQVQKIRSKLKKEGWEEVMVGSTEEFRVRRGGSSLSPLSGAPPSMSTRTVSIDWGSWPTLRGSMWPSPGPRVSWSSLATPTFSAKIRTGDHSLTSPCPRAATLGV